MNEQEFMVLADAELSRIESRLEALADSGVVDFDVEPKPGGIIEIELANGSKIIVNRHGAAREIWLAAKSGGFHFRYDDGRWRGTRDGEELLAVLARCLSQQAGQPVTL